MKDVSEEVWKPVPGYESLYEVSSHGNFKSLCGPCGPREKMLNPSKVNTNSAYLRVCFSKNGIPLYFLAHRIVAIAFLGAPVGPRRFVNHKNFKRNDNNINNLEWVTVKENSAHTIASGRWPRRDGECAGNAKLNWEKVEKIRRLAANGTPRKHLAKVFGVTISNINHIVIKRSWI